jgi:hypothetical protein
MIKSNRLIAILLVIIALNVILPQIQNCKAQTSTPDDEDPSIMIMVEGSVNVHGTGWYAGYVIAGRSGDYVIQVSANGPQRLFPVSNVRVIVLASAQAEEGGLQGLKINGHEITISPSTFTPGIPSEYSKQGGPFKEPDYYGYNKETTLDPLTYQNAKYPTEWISIPITVTFSQAATENSKIMILISGTDSAGKPSLTPFSEGATFVVPEYLLGGLTALTVFLAAFAIIKRKNLPRFSRSK